MVQKDLETERDYFCNTTKLRTLGTTRKKMEHGYNLFARVQSSTHLYSTMWDMDMVLLNLLDDEAGSGKE